MNQPEGQTCQSCFAFDEDLDFCEDPFNAKYHDDHKCFWTCQKCWQESADDI